MFDASQALLNMSPQRRGFPSLILARALCWLCAWSLMSSAQAQIAGQPSWPGRVTWVSDGDTVWVQDNVGATHKVRLLGIDAPEICQDHGHAAKEALQQLLMGHHVTVQGQQLDDYGRLLARLYITPAASGQPSQREGQEVPAALPGELLGAKAGTQDVGRWMVQRGHAWSYRYRNDPGPYVQDEQGARAAGLGLFAAGRAQRPRDFRRHHGPCHEPWVPHS